jgi:murein DD-endopeptidase MepM/ murein hydrolase activator NlpD
MTRFALGLALGLVVAGLHAQGLYKYRDAQGNWVYSDRRPDDTREVEELPLEETVLVPEITIAKRTVEQGIELVATNGCFCPAEVGVKLLGPENVGGSPPAVSRTVAAARRETVLLTVIPADPALPVKFGYQYTAVLGEPEVRHETTEPYRAPFALARSFRISQAPPVRVTHRDIASVNAVDIEMPIGTQIYAARGGTVIEVASSYFEGGADPRNARRANIVRVLHPDGTMALYAHLNWDSIRVKPGQVVRRGEYIADSGNTGFTTGPHLHFAIQRNAGLRLESLPVEFDGPGATVITPTNDTMLIAY